MLRSTLNDIANFILQQNSYFIEGYDEVYLSETGIVHGDEPVFPADQKGDYFYLRLPNNVTFTYNPEFQVSDCMTAPGVQAAITLVAFVRDADPDILVSNLVSTIVNYRGVTTRLQSAIYQPEYVVMQELGKLSKEEQQAALQRIDPSHTIVSVTFQIQKNVTLHRINCNTKPCPSC